MTTKQNAVFWVFSAALAIAATWTVMFLLNGCDRPLPEPLTVVAGDAGTPCARACEKLRANACPEGSPNKTGQTCERTCELAISDSLLPSTYPACVEKAQDKAALRACAVRCGSGK